MPRSTSASARSANPRSANPLWSSPTSILQGSRAYDVSMNMAHDLICSSRWRAHRIERRLLPWGLADMDLGDEVLEVGPGLGATTQVLAQRPGRLTVLEIEPRYCKRLRRDLGGTVTVVNGDATEIPFPDERFSGVVCFTMLHHLPSREHQDRVLAETLRVLLPGGVFAGTDSLANSFFSKPLHLGDTLTPVDPRRLAARLEGVGYCFTDVDTSRRSLRFRARKPV